MKIYVVLSEYQHSAIFDGIYPSLDAARIATEGPVPRPNQIDEDWRYIWIEEWDTDRLGARCLREIRCTCPAGQIDPRCPVHETGRTTT